MEPVLKENLISLLEHFGHEGERNMATWQEDLQAIQANGELTTAWKYSATKDYVMDILLPQLKELNGRVILEGKALLGTHPKDMDGGSSPTKRPRNSSEGSSSREVWKCEAPALDVMSSQEVVHQEPGDMRTDPAADVDLD